MCSRPVRPGLSHLLPSSVLRIARIETEPVDLVFPSLVLCSPTKLANFGETVICTPVCLI